MARQKKSGGKKPEGGSQPWHYAYFYHEHPEEASAEMDDRLLAKIQGYDYGSPAALAFEAGWYAHQEVFRSELERLAQKFGAEGVST